MVLDQVLIQKCREAFSTFDTDKSGTIDIFEMKNLLSAIGQDPSEEEIFRFMQDIDEDRTGQIDFAEFLRVFEKEVSSTREFNNEQDTLDAWVALGGKSDKTGDLNTEYLVQLVEQDFGLTIDIQKILRELDVDGNGKIDYNEFTLLFV
eukprot:GHVL01026054.1.p1 GENE.GHVL01026054.1~~GHVL01026054.1.p1  ORF type:complete len:149 (+),score=26.49 GHVL01026054.1:10-456(+)